MYTKGVSYYVIDSDYVGTYKEMYYNEFKIASLYINDTIIHYDWMSGLGYAEDCVTHDMTVPIQLSADVVALLESDEAVHKWMYRRGDAI